MSTHLSPARQTLRETGFVLAVVAGATTVFVGSNLAVSGQTLPDQAWTAETVNEIRWWLEWLTPSSILGYMASAVLWGLAGLGTLMGLMGLIEATDGDDWLEKTTGFAASAGMIALMVGYAALLVQA